MPPATSSEAPPPAEAEPSAPTSLDTAKQVAQRVTEQVRGQSITLGLGFSQSTGKFTEFKDSDKASAQITDNGTIAPLIQYNSKEAYFWEYPLRVGRVAVGYNLVANYASFSLTRQLTEGPFQGANVGTKITGSYVAAAPMVFARFGPLYPERNIFWKFGAGVGAAALQYQGDIIASTPNGTRLEKVKYNTDSLSLYTTEVWELQVEHWALLFKAALVNGGGRHENFTLEEYSLSLGYTFGF